MATRPPKPRTSDSSTGASWVAKWQMATKKRQARSRARMMDAIQKRAKKIATHMSRKSRRSHDVEFLVVLATTVVVALRFVVLPRLDLVGPDGSGTPMLYMLSANAQAMAAAFALTFSIAFVATQLSTRYGLGAASRFFDPFTYVMSVAFAAAVLLPLYVKGIANPQDRVVWGGFSLLLSSYCLLMLIPFAMWRVRQLGPQMVFDQLLPKKKPDDMWHVDSVEKLCKVEATIAAASQALEYDFAQVGIDRLTDISVRAVRDNFPDGPQQFVECLHRIALKVGTDYRVCWSLQRAVMMIGQEFAVRRYYLGHHALTIVLRTLARRAFEERLAENARMAVTGFFFLGREFAVSSDTTFFDQGVADLQELALDSRWKTMGVGVIGAWSVGCWKVATETACREGPKKAECVLPRLHAAARVSGFNGIERAWEVAHEDLKPFGGPAVTMLYELKVAWSPKITRKLVYL